MADSITLPAHFGKLLYSGVAGERTAIQRFELGTDNSQADRSNGLLAPVFSAAIQYVQYVDDASLVVTCRVPPGAKQINGDPLPTGTSIYEVLLRTEANEVYMAALLTQPIVYDANEGTLIEVPMELSAPVGNVVDTLTVADAAMLPTVPFANLPAPTAVRVPALVVTGLIYEGVDRPCIAYKHGVSAHRWSFSDHSLAAQFSPNVDVTDGFDIPIAFPLYPDETLILFVANGLGYGTTRRVSYRVDNGQPTLRVLGSQPVTLNTNSYVSLYRHATNLLPPTVNVPANYVLSVGQQRKAARPPNQLRLRFEQVFVEPNAYVTVLDNYNIRASRDYEDAHLVFVDGDLLQPGQYAFNNNALSLTRSAPERRPIWLGIFESTDSDSATLLQLAVAANSSDVHVIKLYDRQIADDYAALVFTAEGKADDTRRLFKDNDTLQFTVTPTTDYMVLTQSTAVGVKSYSSPLPYRGVVSDTLVLQLATVPTAVLAFVSGRLNRDVEVDESGKVTFPAEALGKPYTLLTVNARFAEQQVETRNYQWVDPAGSNVVQSYTAFVQELGVLTAGQIATIPAADMLLVFADGAKLANNSYAYLPHKNQLRAKIAGTYTVLGLVRNTAGTDTTVRLRKYPFTSSPTPTPLPGAKKDSKYLVFVGGLQRPIGEYVLNQNTDPVSVSIPNPQHAGQQAYVVEFYQAPLDTGAAGFTVHRRFEVQDYFPLAEYVAKDDMLVFASLILLNDEDYEVTFFDGSAIVDVVPEWQAYATEVFALIAATKPSAVSYTDMERLTNQILFS